MEAYKREFIQFLEKAGVLRFGDFTAKSGRKIPYFINAGMIKTGEEIATLGEFYARAYKEKLGDKKAVLYRPAYKVLSRALYASGDRQAGAEADKQYTQLKGQIRRTVRIPRRSPQ